MRRSFLISHFVHTVQRCIRYFKEIDSVNTRQYTLYTSKDVIGLMVLTLC